MSRQRQTSSKNSVYSDKELLTVDWTFGCRVSERQETTKTMREVINRCIKMTDDIYTTDIKSRNEELKEIKLQIIYRWETVQRDKDPDVETPRLWNHGDLNFMDICKLETCLSVISSVVPLQPDKNTIPGTHGELTMKSNVMFCEPGGVFAM